MNHDNMKNVLLIVEDSEEDFIATQRALKGTDGGITSALVHCQDGEQALDYLFHRGQYADKEKYPAPNLILLDLNLPVIDGLEVLDKIKSNTKLKRIPVIVLTTSSAERDIDRCYELGANSFIQKPVRLDAFFEAVARVKDYWFEIALLPKSK